MSKFEVPNSCAWVFRSGVAARRTSVTEILIQRVEDLLTEALQQIIIGTSLQAT